MLGRDDVLADADAWLAGTVAGRGGVLVISGEPGIGNTPLWLGNLIQRPENHALHHARGIHAFNYGNLARDAVFGTRRNVRAFDHEAGFWDGASRRLLPMLAGRDITRR